MSLTIKKAKIWKSGGSYVLTVPADFIQNGQINTEKEYEVELKEASD